jgi:hypothetical protein
MKEKAVPVAVSCQDQTKVLQAGANEPTATRSQVLSLPTLFQSAGGLVWRGHPDATGLSVPKRGVFGNSI